MTDLLDGFDELSDQMQGQRAEQLRASGVLAGKRNPDEYSRANALADKLGLPTDVVADSLPDFEQQDRLDRAATAGQENPALGDFLSDPRRMALAGDDVDGMVGLSKTIGTSQAISGDVDRTWGEFAGDIGLQFKQLARLGVLGTMETPFNAMNLVNSQFNKAANSLAGLFGEVPDQQVPMYMPEGLRTLRAETEALNQDEFDRNASTKLAGQQLERPDTFFGALQYMATNPSVLATDAAGVAGTMVGGIVPGSRTATIGLQATQQGSMASADVVTALRAKGYSEQDARTAAADAFGWATVAGVIIPNLTPGGTAFEGLVSREAAGLSGTAARRAATALVGETVSEGLEEGAVTAIQNIASLDPWSQGVGGAVAQGMAMGAGMGVPAAASQYAGGRREEALSGEVARVFSSAGGAARLAAMTEAGSKTKLGERSPADLEAFVAQSGGDGYVYLQAEQARVLFQSEAVLAELVGGQDMLVEQFAGGDIAIPVAKWISTVSRMPNAAEIVKHGRMRADDLSGAELESFDPDAELASLGYTPDTDAAAASAEPSTPDSRQQLQDDVFGQLTATGRYTPAAAEAQARLWSAAFARFGAASGQDPMTLYQRYMAGIGDGTNNAQATRPFQGSARMDALIESIRTADTANARQIFGPNLSSFLVAQGGVQDQGGELSARDASKLRPGLVSAAGLELDRARELAVERGYLPEDSDLNAFIDALDADLRGNSVYSEQEGNRERQGFELARQQMLDAISDNETLRDMPAEEFAKLTNQQILEALGGEALNQAANETPPTGGASDSGPGIFQRAANAVRSLFQSNNPQTETTAFKKWFGDSKVVDADGKPLVVYHGTAKDFDSFDNKKTGANDLGLWGRGHYFAASAETASSYALRQGDGARVIPAYVSIKNPMVLRTGSDLLTRMPDGTNTRDLIGQNLDGAKIKVIALEGGHDGVIQIKPDGSVGDVVAFSPTQIKSATGNSGAFDPANPSILNQQASPEGNRGALTIFPDRRMSISLFEKADRSTFIHESGHFFLEVMRDLVAQPDASPKLQAEFATLLEWFGVEDGSQIETRHHEMFARGFEKYVGEGKAPSTELQSVFSQFKAWILSIYRSLINLNVELTDDVRGVFDRMLASDEEIEAAQSRQNMQPLARDANEAAAIGLTEKQFADYQAMLAAATDEAKAEVLAKLMKAHDRAREAWWKEETAAVRAEVEAEFEAMPVFRAARILAGAKTLPDGTPVPEAVAGMKLDKEALVAIYGEAYLKRLGRLYAVEGGVDQDNAAMLLGFTSGDALVKALANRGDLKARVDAETADRMRQRHGDPMTDGTLAEVAMDAVHNTKRVQLLEHELGFLSKLAGQERPNRRALKAVAQQVVAGKTSRQLRPNDYLAAERRAANEATRAAAKGDYAAALLAKRQQAFNVALYAAARDAQKEFGVISRYLKQMMGDRARARLGKAGRDYQEQVDAILELLEVKPISGTAVERRVRLAEWVAKQRESGNPINIPQKLLAGMGLTNISDIPLDDLRDIRDAIKQIDRLADLKNKLLLAGETRDRIEVDNEMAASVEESLPVVPERTGDKTWWENVRKGLVTLDVGRLLPTNIARELDGYREGGAVWSNVIKPIRDAMYGKVMPLVKSMQEAVAGLYAKHYTKEEMRNLDALVWRPEVSDNWSKGRILSLAMNWGSQGNKEAILTQTHSRLTEEQAAGLLRTLDARDWAFVQDMVDQVNSYWPDIAESQRRRKGIIPKKVEGSPFVVTTSDGQTMTIRGGYFPLKYDGDRSGYGATKDEIDDIYNDLRMGRTASASTKDGHAIERVGSGGKTVNLGLDIAQAHMRDVIRDVHLGDAVAYVHTVLGGHAFTEAVIGAGKREHLNALNLWLKDVAAGEMGARHGAEKVLRFVRQNTTAAVLTYKATTSMLQVTGLIQTATVIGRRRTLRGIMRLMGKSWVGPNSIWADIRERSPFMAERFGMIPDAVQLVSDARDGKLKAGHAAMIRWGYVPMARMQMIADGATWLAGEAYGLELFNGDSVKARAYADDLVERGQAPDNFIGKPAIARGTLDEKHRQSEVVKSSTMLLSYMLAKGNVAREKYQQVTSPMEAIKFGVDMIQLFAVETMIMALFTNGLPEDDDDDGLWDDWAAYIAREVAFGNLATVPLLSQLGTAGRGYTPQGVLERTWEAASNTGETLFDGEWNRRDTKAIVTMSGITTGVPSSQINTTAGALWRVRDGEDVSPIEFVIRQERPRE